MSSNNTNTIQTGTKRSADNNSNHQTNSQNNTTTSHHNSNNHNNNNNKNNTTNNTNNRTKSNDANHLMRTNTEQAGTSSSNRNNSSSNNNNNNNTNNRKISHEKHSEVRREPRTSHRSAASRSTTGYEISARGYSNFAERESIELNFTAYERIGSGTFGMIHRIQLDGKDLALKIVHQDPEYCNRELYLLEELRGHENVIHLIYSYYTRFEQRIYLNLITELLDSTLFDKIYNSDERLHRSSRYNSQPITALSTYNLQRCFRDIFKGLEFMHGKKIAHRDLKPENIGFGSNGDAKIIDMGSAKYLDGCTRHSYEICTLLYRAPELLLCNQCYDCGMDIWSVACMLGETITSSPLFFEHQSYTLLKQIIQYLGQPPDELLQSVRGGAFNVVNEQALPKTPADVKRHLKENVVKMKERDDIVDDIVEVLYQCLLYTNRITAENVLKLNFFTRTDLVEDDNSQPPDDSSSPPKMSRVKTRRQTAAETKDGN